MARGFDWARRCNAMPLLEVVRDGDEWTVVNPNIDAHAQPYREP